LPDRRADGNFPDVAGGSREFGYPLIGLLGLTHRGVGNAFRLLNLPADVGHRRGHLLRRGGCRLGIRR